MQRVVNQKQYWRSLASSFALVMSSLFAHRYYCPRWNSFYFSFFCQCIFLFPNEIFRKLAGFLGKSKIPTIICTILHSKTSLLWEGGKIGILSGHGLNVSLISIFCWGTGASIHTINALGYTLRLWCASNWIKHSDTINLAFRKD